MKPFYAIDIIYEIICRNRQIDKLNFRAYLDIPGSLLERGCIKTYSMNVNQFNNLQELQEKIHSIRIPNKWTFGITSRVKMNNGEYYHIPQIDFSCPISKKNLNLIKKQLSQIVKVFPGYILESGKSYHYIGLKLLKEEKWKKFIGNCLLCRKPKDKFMVDVRWFGHSLRRGYTNLRILATNSRPEPKIVAFVKR